jgi:hypothetical protein
MRIKLPQMMLKLGTAMALCMFSTSSLAIPNPANLIQSGYWYGDDGAMCKVVYVIVWQL